MRNKPNGPHGPESAVPKMTGGAPGVPPTGDAAMPVQARTFKPLGDRGPGPKPRRFRVLNGGNFMMGGVRVTLRAGKELDDRNYDIALLRRVGIRLEEIKDEEPAPEPQAAT